MDFTNNVLPIRNYPERDDKGTRVAYLIPEIAITEQEYNDIVKYIGTDGPGWQVLCMKGKYVLHSDMCPDIAKERVLKRVAELKAKLN